MNAKAKITVDQRERCGKRIGPYERGLIVKAIKAGETNSTIAKRMGWSRAAIARLRGVPAQTGRPRKHPKKVTPITQDTSNIQNTDTP